MANRNRASYQTTAPRSPVEFPPVRVSTFSIVWYEPLPPVEGAAPVRNTTLSPPPAPGLPPVPVWNLGLVTQYYTGVLECGTVNSAANGILDFGTLQSVT